MNVGIDASRCRSGGAVVHFWGIINNLSPELYGVTHVHAWVSNEIWNSRQSYQWLTLHRIGEASSPSLLSELYFQWAVLSKRLVALNCSVLFSADASTLCGFTPQVVLAQDLLSYEPRELSDLRIGADWLRLKVLRVIQKAAFRRANEAIFLTEYARDVIVRDLELGTPARVIPHGIEPADRLLSGAGVAPSDSAAGPGFDRSVGSLELLYVSPVAPYKHQIEVIEAIALLRRNGVAVRVQIVGGGGSKYIDELERTVVALGLDETSVSIERFLPRAEVIRRLLGCDIFLFASTCESMPITLLEAMQAGCLICSSNYGAMPEILKDAGIYFDPRDSEDIARAIQLAQAILPESATLRQRGRSLAAQYTWERARDKTWRAIIDAASPGILGARA